MPREDVDRRANGNPPISVESLAGSGICAEFSSYYACVRTASALMLRAAPDGHDVVRSGLRAILEVNLKWQVVEEAVNGKGASPRRCTGATPQVGREQ